MKKKILLLSIILIPSLIYFMFELSEVNFKKMAFYGPKTTDAKGDTVYYTLPDEAFAFGKTVLEPCLDSAGQQMLQFVFVPDKKIKTSQNAFIILFVKKGAENKLSGLLEYEKYKKEKLNDLNISLIREAYFYIGDDTTQLDLFKNSQNVKIYNAGTDSLDFSKLSAFYFKQKPIHVFDYFAVLVDKDHHIRGYYDPTYISEVKHMIEEYKHLVLKDAHADMQNSNRIEQSR